MLRLVNESAVDRTLTEILGREPKDRLVSHPPLLQVSSGLLGFRLILVQRRVAPRRESGERGKVMFMYSPCSWLVPSALPAPLAEAALPIPGLVLQMSKCGCRKGCFSHAAQHDALLHLKESFQPDSGGAHF